MTYPRSLFKAAVLAAPLGAMALSAQAADVVGTIKEQQQFSKLAQAIEQAGMAQSLQGGGPYTVFAPTDQAFEQLPQGALDELMKEENRDQLETLLQYHVVEGKELRAKDAVGKQTEVDTLAGDSLSVDGSGQMVLLVPTGLTVTRIGDQVIVERDVAAVTAPEVEVAPTGQTASPSGQQTEAQTEVTEQGDMPATPHQQQVLRGEQGGEQQQSASGSSGQTQSQAGQQTEAQTEVTEQGDMPATEHQQQVLREQPATEQQQTAPQDTGMPSSPHQEQALRGEQPGEQQSGQQQEKGVLREATVVDPDIQADNGVIHAIDAVLVPQAVLSKLESMGQGQQSQGQEGQAQRSKAKQG
jgi:uncharacterized surface protein with fasciclin (FAS1) repeats